jgi:hypothetical protein
MSDYGYISNVIAMNLTQPLSPLSSLERKVKTAIYHYSIPILPKQTVAHVSNG